MKPNDIHAIIVLAERVATALIKEEQRRKGKRISLMTGPTIKAQALELLKNHPEIYTQARERWEAETNIKLVC
jgi:hypothetical protein